jgi:hypothetical protein
MSDQDQITLQISVAQIEQYCVDLCQGTSNISRKHATLIALEGIITRYSSTDAYSAPFHKILSIIQGYSEQTRELLLKEYADELIPALAEQNPRLISRIHESLSRNGFDLILDRALNNITLQHRASLKKWVDNWCDEAEAKALAASGFPDAFNFKGTDIALADYRAMSELKRKLSTL